MKLSIIIINYNYSNFLVDCIKSISKNQINYSHEIIFIDDASTDDSINIAKAAFSKYKIKNYQIISNKTVQKTFKSRQIGLHHAKGEYVTFHEAYNTYLDDAFLHVSQLLKDSKYNLLQYKIGRINQKKNQPNLKNKSNSSFNFETPIQQNYHCFHLIFKKELLQKCLYMANKYFKSKLNYHEDVLIMATIPLIKNEIKYFSVKNYCCMHQQSGKYLLSHNNKADNHQEKIDSLLSVCYSILRMYLENDHLLEQTKINFDVNLFLFINYCLWQNKEKYLIYMLDSNIDQLKQLLKATKPMPKSHKLISLVKESKISPADKIGCTFYPIFLINPKLTLKFCYNSFIFVKNATTKLSTQQK